LEKHVGIPLAQVVKMKGKNVPKMASAFYKERRRLVAGLHAEKKLPWPDFPDMN